MTALDRIANATKRVVDRFFVPATISRSTNGVFDPISGEVTEGGARRIACKALSEVVETKSADGTLSRQTTLLLTAAPEIGDTIKFGSTTYRVEDFEVIAPDGNALLWRAVVSR